jgi:hypothetical protein
MNKSLAALSLAGLMATGCASAQARSKPEEAPALMVPPAPPRVIEPVVEATPEPVPDLPAAPSAPPVRQSRPPRDTGPRPEKPADPKAGDPKPVEQPPVETPPPPPVTPPAQLRTPQTADTGAAKAAQTTIDAARGLLNTVNFGPLTNERKKAYNDAKLLIQQAEDALKQGNVPFAQAMGTKAETLAKELAGR